VHNSTDGAKHGGELSGPRRDPPLDDHRPVGRHDPNVAVLCVQIDGTLLHGWLLLCALSA
jgi:hypothetical protein